MSLPTSRHNLSSANSTPHPYNSTPHPNTNININKPLPPLPLFSHPRTKKPTKKFQSNTIHNNEKTPLLNPTQSQKDPKGKDELDGYPNFWAWDDSDSDSTSTHPPHPPHSPPPSPHITNTNTNTGKGTNTSLARTPKGTSEAQNWGDREQDQRAFEEAVRETMRKVAPHRLDAYEAALAIERKSGLVR
ncbi:hypothetical protein HYFRA_00010366 [Hymenoscyphus fraxineus]|uniref:Uncharacterized protein n=1 Tax=Hymenoscyphus fraxineus TaxID=746836 RepID=A0A9N9KX52_9HELO|nr:hypothetical protein HYFRA_00010366 [Hymenoscyphus fraxineus]